MKKKKILIIGDSFAADWSVKYQDYPGWPNLLANLYTVTNLAQAGVGEYKILQQLLSVDDLSLFDIVIVSHTSPYRIYTRVHPIHKKDKLHKHADLMLNDLIYHRNTFKGFFNRSLSCAIGVFQYHSDDRYFETVYQLTREKIAHILKDKKTIVIDNFYYDKKRFADEKIVYNYQDLACAEPGLINHFSYQANLQIFHDLEKEVNK